MDDKTDGNKLEEIILPGFRFHPTDEELVAFYLKRKIQQRPLAIELIKQLDIYKHDPWDLPKLAANGEKEWYFYCPRDRKYRNSARPNRVTGAGFWKATGTDRPIYSSEGTTKCIGLKKSLVFYKGRAARGIKTDWMMHEFRLPSPVDSVHPKRFIDKAIPANDAWAICRIFKKANTTAQRTVSHSWVSPDNLMLLKNGDQSSCSQFRSTEPSIISSTPKPNFPFSYDTLLHQHHPCPTTFSPSDHNLYHKHIASTNVEANTLNNLIFPPQDTSIISASMLFNITSPSAEEYSKGAAASDSSDFADFHSTLPQGVIQAGHEHDNIDHHLQELNDGAVLDETTWNLLYPGFGFSVDNPPSDAEKPNLVWDCSPCPSEMSTNYKCYT
ncbi:unnamed protein product [Rhodiola kirilowii]